MRREAFPGICGSGITLRAVVDGSTSVDLSQALPKTQVAVQYASQRHEGQQRQVDGQPFILHPLEVGSLLYGAGAPDEVVAAGLLHDTLEKTDTSEPEVSKARELSVGDGLAQTVRRRRMTHYRRCLALLEERLPDFPLVGMLHKELERLTDRRLGEHATAPCG